MHQAPRSMVARLPTLDWLDCRGQSRYTHYRNRAVANCLDNLDISQWSKSQMSEAKPCCHMRQDIAAQNGIEADPAFVFSEMMTVLADFILAFECPIRHPRFVIIGKFPSGVVAWLILRPTPLQFYCIDHLDACQQRYSKLPAQKDVPCHAARGL